MMNETMTGANYEVLECGPCAPVIIRNMLVSSDTTVERGMLLSGLWDGYDVTVSAATGTDTAGGNDLYVAMRDEPAGATVTSAYANGVFNRKAIKVSAGLKVEAFEHELRKQNIILTEVLGDD